MEALPSEEIDTNMSLRGNGKDVQNHYFRMAWVLVKVLYLIVIFVLAIIAYYKKKKGFTKETFLFVFFILELAAIVVYDIVHKYLLMLYLMQVASQFAIFYSFLILVRSQKQIQSDVIRDMEVSLTKLLIGVYAATALVGFFPGFGATCASWVYPPAFLTISGVYMVMTIVAFCSYLRHYFMNKEVPAELEQFVEEGEYSLSTYFSKQVRIFFVANFLLCSIQLTISIYGITTISKEDHVVCNSGNVWLGSSFIGEIFLTVHILVLIFQGVMIEQMFYSVPKSHGHFFSTLEAMHPLLRDHQEV